MELIRHKFDKEHAVAAHSPEERISDYRLVRRLTPGGMDHVWVAIDLNTESPVVLKFIRQD
jgi:hypothetical protein